MVCSRKRYKNDPLVCFLWKKFKAVPPVPLTADLDVLQVLKKEKPGGYPRLGKNLADLCAVDSPQSLQKQADLTAILVQRSPTIFEVGAKFTISTTIKKKTSVLAALGIAGISGSASFERAKELKMSMPELHNVRVAEGDLGRIMKDYEVDMDTFGDFIPGKQDFELWVIDQVIFCPSIILEAISVTNVSASGSGPLPAGPAVVQVEAKFSVVRSTETLFELKGEEIPGTDPPQYKPIPVAFRAYKYAFNREGIRLPRGVSRFEPDGPHARTEQIDEDDPANDPNMGAFVANGTFPTIGGSDTWEVPEESNSEAEDE